MQRAPRVILRPEIQLSGTRAFSKFNPDAVPIALRKMPQVKAAK
jgi:hypothetical protein